MPTEANTNGTSGESNGVFLTKQSSQVDELIRVQIPSWNQLFGQNSQCECQECESMTGAAAYFTRILYFIEHCTPNDNKETPYDILIRRVPYLQHLLLTCENTNKQLPYIQIVLEMLEFYTATNDIKNLPAYDSGNDSWMSDYLLTAEKAYQKLAITCFPFSLPYHQPLDVIRTYLSKLNTSFTELLQVFGSGDNDNKLHLIKENLSLSDEEYSLLTEFKIGGNPVNTFALYGFNNAEDFQNSIYGVGEFLNRTGLLYIELIEILKTEYVNPGSNAINFIENLFIGDSTNAASLFTQLKTIRNTNTNDALLATINGLLIDSASPGIDPAEFKSWVDSHFEDFQNAIVIIPTGDPCNYATSNIGTILSANDPSVKSPISEDIFKKLYFFIHLLRKRGFKISELDELLNSLAGKTNNKVIEILSGAELLMKKFSFTTGQISSFYGNLEPNGDSKIYTSLFLNKALSQINLNFNPDVFGNYFVAAVPLKFNNQYNQVLLSALQLSPFQMDLLANYIGIKDTGSFHLSIEAISVFYSYAVLAASLNLQVTDLVNLLTVFGQPTVLRQWDPVANAFNDADLQITLSFLEFIKKVNSSKFSISEFLFVMGNNTIDLASSQITEDKIKQSIIALQQGFTNTEQENPIPDKEQLIDGSLIKNKLLLLYDNNIVLQLVGILNGKILYGMTLSEKPDLNFPIEFANKIVYSKDTGRLQVTGVLSSADWNLLTDELKAVLQPIFDKPVNFLEENFSTLILDKDNWNKILDRNDIISTEFEKYKFFYDLYQPYLIKKLKYKQIIKQLSSHISLDEKLTYLITTSFADDLYNLILKIISELSISPEIYPVADINDFGKELRSLYKTSLFVSKFELNATEVAFFISASKKFSDMDFYNPTLANWQRMNNYILLRKYNRSSDFTFIDLFKQASTNSTAMQLIITMIALLTGWSTEDIASLINNGNYAVSDFSTEAKLYEISLMMSVVRKTNIKASQLISWARTDTSFHSLTILGADIKNNLLLQYDEMQREDNAMTIEANIWERQRNAHVDYILTLDQIKNVYKITNVEELCGYFLIELPMNSCMLTTRLRQAISTVQSFIKRCLMKLEVVFEKDTGRQVGVSPDQIDNDIWEPMSHFRTWQVTMEFLTNPYPYLSYQYLIDKSDAAIALEETILKSDITQQTVEDAFRIYVKDLSEMSNLEIVSMYIDDFDTDKDPESKLIHVIGKSRSTPPNYYYCTKDEENKWSFWRKITVAIKENDSDSNGQSGASVIFVKFKNRYYLFMPEFIKRQETNSAKNNKKFNEIADQYPNDVIGKEYWEVKIAVSEYYQKKWSAKKYINPSGDTALFKNINESYTSGYFFTTQITADDILILSLHNQDGKSLIDFTFKSINSSIGINPGGDSISLAGNVTLNQGIFYQNIRVKGQMKFPTGENESTPAILQKGGEKFFNFSPQFASDLVSVYRQPFFFHDKNRSFYVTSVDANYTIQKTEYTIVSPPILQVSASKIETIRNPEKMLYLPLHFNQ